MYKLLIADDEEIEINAFKLMVSNHFKDISVISASNGIEAMLITKAEKPDIVFMDIEMPGFDGLTVISELKNKLPNSRFIVHTAYNNFDYAQKAIKIGADDYLLKPVKMQVLLDIIQNSISEIEKKRYKDNLAQELEMKMVRFKPFIEKDIILSLVNGADGPEMLTQYASIFGFPMAYVLCAIFKIDEYEYEYENEYDLDDDPDNDNKIVGTLKQISNCIAAEYISGSVLAIIPFEEPLKDDEVQKWSVQLVKFVSSKLNANVKAGIGPLTTIEDIQTSYYEAFKAISSNTPGKHVPYTTVNASANQIDIRQCESEIGKLIVAGKNREALIQSENLFNGLMDQYKAIDILKTKLVESCFIIKRFIEVNTIEGFSVNFGGDLAILLHLTSFEALKRWLVDFVNNMATQMENQSGKHNSEIVGEVKSYIEKNYDKDITLESVAASVCVTPWYLSRLFKKETGKNFSTYLTQSRIDKAKELLRSTNKSIKTVSYDTGFKSQAYFSKIFKKIEGVSPREFTQDMEKN